MTSPLRTVRRTLTAPAAIVMGTNEIASAVAVYLHRGGFSVVLCHDPNPPVIRRKMAFHDALFGDPAWVGGIEGIGAETSLEVASLFAQGRLAVTALGLLDLIPIRAFDVLIDARMQKRERHPDLRHLAGLTIGLGPGFAVNRNCDAAVETLPAKAGAVVYEGATAAADGKARNLAGAGAVYSEEPGRWHCAVDIGTRVYKNFPAGILNGAAVIVPMDGILRGVVRDGTEVPAGVKLLEIDPRKRAQFTGIDERGAAIARATMEAIASAQQAAPYEKARKYAEWLM